MARPRREFGSVPVHIYISESDESDMIEVAKEFARECNLGKNHFSTFWGAVLSIVIRRFYLHQRIKEDIRRTSNGTLLGLCLAGQRKDKLKPATTQQEEIAALYETLVHRYSMIPRATPKKRIKSRKGYIKLVQ